MSRPTDLSGRLWPIHLKPFDDELLSSWMIRLARAYDIKPVWFWRLFWPVDFRTVDIEAPGGLLDLLARRTATSFERALETTLTAMAQEHSIARTLRYCVPCMAKGPQYFRRRWQLRSFLLCERHGVPLRTGCSEWGHELTPEAASPGEDSILWCSRCRSTVRIPGAEPFVPCRPVGQVLDWQSRLWNLLANAGRMSHGDYA